MIVYAESSAVLSWLLGEPEGRAVRTTLAEAEQIVASALTLVECHRALIRAVALGEATEGAAADRNAALRQAAAHWHVISLTAPIFARAQLPFPVEPIRTLDALHLASALEIRSTVADVQLLSLDQRLRHCATALGFRLLPR